MTFPTHPLTNDSTADVEISYSVEEWNFLIESVETQAKTFKYPDGSNKEDTDFFDLLLSKLRISKIINLGA